VSDETGETPEPAGPPSLPPFAPEDSVYAAIVSEFYGLQRAGAGMLGAALITGTHYAILGLAGSRAEPGQD
jgi:hypothetical protein